MKYPELRSITDAEYKRGKDHDREKAIKRDKQKIEEEKIFVDENNCFGKIKCNDVEEYLEIYIIYQKNEIFLKLT